MRYADPRDRELVRGLRRAMAEMVVLRVEAEARITPKPCKANRDRRAAVRAFKVAYNRLSQVLLDATLPLHPETERHVHE